MKLKRLGFLFASCALATSAATAQVGPDIAVSQIGTGGDWAEYGNDGTFAAYGMATTSCNVGNQVVDWFDHIGRAPLIAQNMYRITDGRIEQLGYAFLKLSFCAVSEPSCGSCQATGCNTLGVGCADTYGSGLNDGAFGGAGKWIWNPTVPQIWPNNPPLSAGSLPTRGRLVVRMDEMAQAGSIYVAESQYLSRHDQENGLGRNNASWRFVNVPNLNNVNNGGPMNVGDPGIFAWQDHDPNVTIREVLYNNEGGAGVHGHMFLGYNVTDLGGGQWRYEYALHNLDSDAAIGSFQIPLGCEGTEPVITDVYFRGVRHHSGDPRSDAAWNSTVDATSIRWEAPEDFDTNPQGSAIWWGEMFNFGFTADMPPAMAQASMGTFKNVPVAQHFATIEGPCGSPICGVESFCSTAPNSFSAGATISATGDASIAANNIKLTVNDAVPGSFGLFFYGPTQIQTAFGDGFRCAGGMTSRIPGNLQANSAGAVTRSLDLNAPPANMGTGLIEIGSTANFQFWFRDVPAGGAGFNLTDGVSVTFCP